jgi:hypothetical protein
MNAFAVSPLAVAAAVMAIVVAIVLLYLLQPPARRRFVSSSLIWEKVLEASRRVSDRWRWWLSLFIAGTIGVCVVLAVVRPGIKGSEGSGKAIIVVDNAPTMATRTLNGVPRFRLAQDRAIDLIGSFTSAMQVMIVDTQRHIGTPAFESRVDAIETVEGLQLGREYLPIVPSAIASIAAEGRYVVTDGVLLGAPPTDFTSISVFEPAENLGITAFDLQNVPGSPAQREAFIEVSNAGSNGRTTEIVVSGTGDQRVTRQVSVEANSVVTQIIDLSMFNGGPVRAALTSTDDAFADDDVAFGYLSSRRIVRVTLVSNSDGFLAKSLSSQPRVRLNVVPPHRYADKFDTDIYIFDRFAPKAAPSVPSLLIGPQLVGSQTASWLPSTAGNVILPEVTTADARHPLLQNISLRDLHIEKANVSQPSTSRESTVLLHADGDKVLAVAHDGATRWVLLGFDSDDSNFGLLPGFPVFLGNAINWLVDEPAIVRATPGRVTVPFETARVFAMNGSELPVMALGGEVHFDATTSGLYTVIGKDRPVRVAVNLLDRRISAVNRSALGPSTSAPSEDGTMDELPVALSALLLVIAAAFMCFEWIAYHRRVTL